MKSRRRLAAVTLSFSSLLASMIVLALPMTTRAAAPARVAAVTNDFRGVNWADPRDNFDPDAVVPTGLSATDSYTTTKAKAGEILDGFTRNLGANTVRLPINPQSVGTAWWRSYRGAIDEATAKGYKVILSFWEYQDGGTVGNTSTWLSMWQTVVSVYGGNPNVYFEPMNEPHGYTYAQWSALCAAWLSKFPSVPRGRVVISGTHYNTDVTQFGADSRFNGTLLSVHDYRFFNSKLTTYAQFKAQIASEVGAYSNRTIIDEFGGPQTDGTNYHQAGGTNAFVNFPQAISDFARQNAMGTVYLPALRGSDWYSIQQLTGTYPNLTVTTTNSSGRDLILGSWGRGNARTGTVTGAAGKCLDVTSAGAGSPKVVLANCSGSSSQRWMLSNGALTSGGECADASGAGTANGTPVIAYPCSGHANQQWVLLGHEFRNGNSGTCLEVPGSTAVGTQLVLSSCTGAPNQTWSLNG